MKAELITIPTEITDESIKQYLADCSSVVRNAQPKDNERLFQRLLKESYGGKASRVFEFVPCVLREGLFNCANCNQYFGHFDFVRNLYYTTARELLNCGWSWKEVLKVIDFTHYRAVKITAPYFVYGQVSTHTQITSVSHSNRYTDAGLGYWIPPEIPATVDMTQEEWNYIVENFPPIKLQSEMKRVISRREVYARGSDMLAYRVATLGGYTNNPNAWQHFVNQRLHDLHTQKETRELTALIEAEIRRV